MPNTTQRIFRCEGRICVSSTWRLQRGNVHNRIEAEKLRVPFLSPLRWTREQGYVVTSYVAGYWIELFKDSL